MINKQNLWFVTLFSLIIILGIYYISINDEVATVLLEDSDTTAVIEISESDILVSLEVDKEEEKQALLEEYQETLLASESTIQEKNTAYENIQKLNNTSQMEEKIKGKIKETFNLNAFVKITDTNISVVIASSEHNTDLANQIIRSVQSLYDEEQYITVKFNS